MTPSSAEERDDLGLLSAALAEAAALARNAFVGQRQLEVSYKRGGSPVTALDLEIDTALKERLRPQRPAYGWLSEETVDDDARLGAGRVFVVDPLDGTRAFLKGRPHFTVCGAVVERGRPIVAVVINPMTEETFAAVAGRGATLNGMPIGASQRTTLEGARLLGPIEMWRHPAWPEPWPELVIDNPNSLAYRLCLVASGARDGCLRLSSSYEWDLVAGHLIAAEAGAEVTSHSGAPFSYNQPRPMQPSLIAAGPGLYQEIYRRVRKIVLPTPS